MDATPRSALTRAQVRELDRLAIEDLGIPGCVLMENAGAGAARAAIELARNDLSLAPEGLRVVVFCGAGNNGGDGYVVARHLANAGARVDIITTVPEQQLAGDAAWAAEVARKMGLVARPFVEGAAGTSSSLPRANALLIDALLGTGASGAPRPPIADAIEAINAARAAGATLRVVALDLPSGLDADTGRAESSCVRADVTVTFEAVKVGLLAMGAKEWTGRVVIAPIGAPRELVLRVRQSHGG